MPVAVALAAVGAIVGPHATRRSARAALGCYAVAIGGACASATRRGTNKDAATLPAVYATMHFAYGFGFVAGCAQQGVPLPAIRHATRLWHRKTP